MYLFCILVYLRCIWLVTKNYMFISRIKLKLAFCYYKVLKCQKSKKRTNNPYLFKKRGVCYGKQQNSTKRKDSF